MTASVETLQPQTVSSLRHSRFHLPMAALFAVAATDTDSLLGLLLGVPRLRFVSIALLAALALYLFANGRATGFILARPLAALWFTVLTPLPIAITFFQALLGLYPPDEAMYWIGVIALSGMLFLGSTLWAARADDRATSVLILAMLALSFIGFLVQHFDYELIRRTMAYASNALVASTDMPRLLGFYSHPNFAALSLVVLTLPLFTSLNRNGFWTAPTILLLAAIAGCIIATGSRTSLALLTLAAILVTIRAAAAPHQSTRNALPVFVTLALLVLLAAILGPHVFGPNTALGPTLSRLVPIFDPSSWGTDPSAALRAGIVEPYLALSAQRPFIGFGHDFLARTIGTATLPIVSQNTWLQYAIEYGWPYVFAAATILAFSLVSTMRYLRAEPAVSRSAFGLLCLLLVLLVASFSINDLFLIRSVLVAFGLLLGTMIRVWAAERSAP